MLLWRLPRKLCNLQLGFKVMVMIAQLDDVVGGKQNNLKMHSTHLGHGSGVLNYPSLCWHHMSCSLCNVPGL